MAVDKLSVLRRERACFEILLKPKDLKVFPRDKRKELLDSLTQPIDAVGDQASDDDQKMLGNDEAQESRQESADQRPSDQATKLKKKKRKSSLISSHRSKNAGCELAWIQNTKTN